ncbi:hypothetical protein ACSBR2_013331 [Camellia fascicularis]
MKLVKSKLRNRMEDGFLASYLITYIEKDITRGFDVFWLSPKVIILDPSLCSSISNNTFETPPNHVPVLPNIFTRIPITFDGKLLVSRRVA